MGHLKNIICAFKNDGVQAALNYNFITESSRPAGMTISLKEVFQLSPLETLATGILFVDFLLLSGYTLNSSQNAQNLEQEIETLVAFVGAAYSGFGYYIGKLYVINEAYQRRVEFIRRISGH